MIIPVKCTNCGNILADKLRWETYKNFLEEFNSEESLKKLNAGLSSERTAQDFALEKAGLFKMCCRTQIMSNIDLTDII